MSKSYISIRFHHFSSGNQTIYLWIEWSHAECVAFTVGQTFDGPMKWSEKTFDASTTRKSSWKIIEPEIKSLRTFFSPWVFWLLDWLTDSFSIFVLEQNSITLFFTHLIFNRCHLFLFRTIDLKQLKQYLVVIKSQIFIEFNSFTTIGFYASPITHPLMKVTIFLKNLSQFMIRWWLSVPFYWFINNMLNLFP